MPNTRGERAGLTSTLDPVEVLMFRMMTDFHNSWKHESAATLKVFDAIPDSAIEQAVADGHRTLRRMAWHLVESLIEMPGRMDLEVDGRHFLTGRGTICEPPASMQAIRDAYAKASASLVKGLAGWTDADLIKEDDMYGEKWKRGASLMVLVGHQTHHRGQMTVLMRQAGLKVPDIYGPAKEGWAAYGAEPPSV